MANRTVKDAHSIHGTNPQYLVEKIIRTRIYESKYWKEECFGLTAELVVDKAMELRFVGGVLGGNIKPTPFLCLTLKMLQIQPEKDIIVEFIKNEDFKYVRMLGALYMRLTGTAIDCYKYLEPLYNDYRKIKSQNRNGEFELMHVDEFIDELLHSERVCDIILPRLQKRYVLEEAEQLEPRVSLLEDMDDVQSSEEEEEEDEKLERVPSPDHRRRSYRDLDKPRHAPRLCYRRSRSQSPRRRSPSLKRRSPSPCQERHRRKSPRRHRSRSRDRRHRSRPKSPGHHRSHRHRSHSKSPERSKKSHRKSRRGNE
ncbi:pre-mRNA-splicing factor 38A-like [Perognathus longimembris pacificus]|uniref:pre-mRNA-splicing factor 38A-like n=1 Tax=Perognathus longimembris pacificus TaxID=214514 RepID=UPI002019286A|nr:pre-mRNA-splicing factor 38A-like [Perognathus longimembris pacificus]XP_048207678.1 pre-mRNA-splicing factor 38A-like [Perognathus longimembris pacificus]